MSAMISVDAYSFLACSDLTCQLENTGMFLGRTVPPDSKETKPGSSDQESSPSAGKNIRILLVPCHLWNISRQLFTVVWIFPRSLGVICYDR